MKRKVNFDSRSWRKLFTPCGRSSFLLVHHSLLLGDGGLLRSLNSICHDTETDVSAAIQMKFQQIAIKVGIRTTT